MKVAELLTLPLDTLATILPNESWSLGTQVGVACLLEAAAMKAGNVHPYAAFSDMNYEHFCQSAVILETVFDETEARSLGSLVLNSVQATRHHVGVNTNLGIILLVCPIAIAWRMTKDSEEPGRNIDSLFQRIGEVLSQLDSKDCRDVYAAIGYAKAGGLGQVASMDIHATPPSDLMEAMRSASRWDAIARMYATNFQPFRAMQRRLASLRRQYRGNWLDALQHLQLECLARDADTLISRRNPSEVVDQVRRLADEALQARNSMAPDALAAWKRLDDYLRADGHRRNPGTTADLLAATLLLCLLSER